MKPQIDDSNETLSKLDNKLDKHICVSHERLEKTNKILKY